MYWLGHALLNVFILISILFHLKLKFKLKADLEVSTFKNLEEVLITCRKFAKSQ